MEESKSFSKAPGYYHSVLVIFIYLFVYLFIFSLNKFFSTTVNRTFYNSSLLEFFWNAEAVPQRCSPRGGCSVDMLRIFGGVSVRGCDFNKVTKQLCWGCASMLLLSFEFASCLQSIFLAEHLSRTASEQIWFYLQLLIYSF